MKERDLLKKMFIELLANIVNASNHKKCAFLNNQQFIFQATLINLHPNEYRQGSCFYAFAVNLVVIL